MHLVGYLYEDYHDARPLEHKTGRSSCAFNFRIQMWALLNYRSWAAIGF